MVIAVLALAACSDDPTGGSRAIVSVQVSAVSPLVEVGDSVLLSAAPKRVDGTTRTDVEVTWMSMNTDVATVQARAGQKAVVVGKQPGAVTIRAMAEDKIGQTSLDVIVTSTPVPVLTSIVPTSASEGDQLVEITVKGEHFNEITLIRWNDVAIATQFISATELRGVIPSANLAQAGTAEVTVRTGPPGGGTSTGKPFNILPRVATVHVDAPQGTLWVGEQVEVTATPRDAAGRDLPKRPTQWGSADPDIVSVTPDGKVTPLREGLAVVYAIVDGTTGSTSIYAVQAPPYALMYDSQRGNGGRELWIVSLGADATPRRWLPAGFWGEDAATTRDGTKIVFVSRDQFLNTDIWVANRDGSGLTRLTTHAGADDQPVWSPDGTKIAFRSSRAAHGQSQIWIMNADGSDQRNLMGDSWNVLDGQQSRPSFGTNDRIYFQVYYPWTQTSKLASMPVNGNWTQLVEHTPDGYSDTDPAVSWDGSKIMLRRKLGSHDQGIIYTDLQGNALIALNYPGLGFTPTWGRNDQWLTFSSSPTGDHPTDVYVTRLDAFWRKHMTSGVAIGGGRNPIFIKR